MKRKEMNAEARSLCEHLMSRNNDIGGFWGVGKLCSFAIRERRTRFSFKIYPGLPIRVSGSELTGSTEITSGLIEYSLDSIEGRLSFFSDGRYSDGSNRYICGIAISLTQDRRTGMFLSHVYCWPHDPTKELRSNRFNDFSLPKRPQSIINKMRRIITSKEVE
jgi:hypothetical protein